ncbi:ImmA/IrrE family metallo-endopeptidase [Oceanobacillus neutriphilus]|uniref:IrrE N-terminal-like domain-containing protein n=1 Tax=Oceanobacillus neutriphilus TaxID=531815 RepID=A0ABQ2P234_9BACI|nr:ImmA/IrrE family metallo-endopeptidase [Oceanobacillus neutriphilus]GGP16247.1 hypothetical protein GCM10011346_47460 [Oceanobacillus neutriphilus]
MLPSRVVVAGINYEIKEVDGLAEEHNLGGQILYEKGIIKIDSSMCKDKKEQVLVHEILHSIFNEAGYNEQDEDMVNRLGIVLYQVFKDNNLHFGEIEEVEEVSFYDGVSVNERK